MAPEYCLTKLDSALLGNSFPQPMRVVDNMPRHRRGVTTSRHPIRLHIVSATLGVVTTIEPIMEHAIYKPIESRLAYQHRRHTIAFAMVLALSVAVALTILLVG
jgi:hypothetical protein